MVGGAVKLPFLLSWDGGSQLTCVHPNTPGCLMRQATLAVPRVPPLCVQGEHGDGVSAHTQILAEAQFGLGLSVVLNPSQLPVSQALAGVICACMHGCGPHFPPSPLYFPVQTAVPLSPGHICRAPR